MAAQPFAVRFQIGVPGEQTDPREGFWNGYALVRVPADGDPRGVIVEQRPVFDWITMRASGHVVRPGQRLTLKGYGREPEVAFPTVVIERVPVWNRARPKPYMFLLFSESLSHCCCVPGDTRMAWTKITLKEDKRVQARTFYQVDKKLCHFLPTARKEGSDGSAG